MDLKINIAIDGFSASGKSTIAKKLTKKLKYLYLDTGAMYRAVTLFFLDNNVNISDINSVTAALKLIDLKIEQGREANIVTINGNDITGQLRTVRVMDNVSKVAEISEVRKFLVEKQKHIAAKKGVIMDGRDIGTVVLPDAEIKIYLTTKEKIRIERRLQELINNGQEVDVKKVTTNIRQRDIIDSTREDSPLRIASDALIIDNSNADEDILIEELYQLIQEKIRFLNIDKHQNI